jgi:hypothetical protein
MIEDEEFLLIQTPQKTKPASGDGAEKRIKSPSAQRWFACEYFYSQMDKIFFVEQDFSLLLQKLGIGGARLSQRQWSVLRTAILTHKSFKSE